MQFFTKFRIPHPGRVGGRVFVKIAMPYMLDWVLGGNRWRICPTLFDSLFCSYFVKWYDSLSCLSARIWKGGHLAAVFLTKYFLSKFQGVFFHNKDSSKYQGWNIHFLFWRQVTCYKNGLTTMMHWSVPLMESMMSHPFSC